MNMVRKNPKNFLPILCFLSLILMTLPAFSAVLGDVNNSGKVDIIDALLVAQYSVGLSPNGFDSTVADVNGDGQITIIDALLIAQFSGGIIIIFPTPGVTNTPTPTPSPTPSPCTTCTRYESGTVTNANGQPVAGASIYELSTLITTTDSQGKYAYARPATKPGGMCPTGDTYLIVKMTGYKDYSSLTTVDCGTYSHSVILQAQ